MNLVQFLEELVDEVETMESVEDVVQYLHERIEDLQRDEEIQAFINYDEENDDEELI